MSAEETGIRFVETLIMRDGGERREAFAPAGVDSR